MENTILEITSSLPPGFRFHPTAEELLLHYLKPKILERQPNRCYYDMLPEINVLEFEPWQLPSWFGHMFSGKELFFFCHVKRKYLKSNRSDRTTKAGYWKPTGKVRAVMDEDTDAQIGIKRTLVFHEGHMPNGKRTNWVMYEYYLNPKCLGNNHDENEMLPYVVCRIKQKKDKKLMKGHAPTISPGGYSNSPYTDTSNVSEIPMNQEGDYSSFCDNLHNEVADFEEVVHAQPEMSVEELMESPPPSQPLDGILSYDYTTPAYQPQAGPEEGSSSFLGLSYDKDGNRVDHGYVPSPYSNPANYPGFDWGYS
ncbi:hypothetical protein BT93_L1914 [Corymbia citriodora subsp. variegata]|uniref:NAC domain-containing protein n=1 Tax=Corymbia citriodora subsp. variegata TaxID=360336 RepID=A0A8T0CLE1_CORYI|nr:hypothetical protein BT93_L1914 [Corymbia citriodora subsp. variegata]